MEFIMTSDDLDLSERAKENLLQNVSDMKMEVVRIGNAYKPSDKENTEVKEVKRCRFNNTPVNIEMNVDSGILKMCVKTF